MTAILVWFSVGMLALLVLGLVGCALILGSGGWMRLEPTCRHGEDKAYCPGCRGEN